MKSFFNFFVSHCRSNIYLLVGVFLGLSISLLFVPLEINDCSDLLESSLPYSLNTNDIDEYEPKFNVNGKPQKAQKTPKVLVRPRYYSTELDIHEKLFIGVLTSHEYLHNRAIASNKTIAHLVDKVRYFISIQEGSKPNVTLPGIVGFTDTRSILQPFHALKYMTDNYLKDYDYYFLVKDTSYINARKLNKIVNKLSLSQDIYMGVNSEIDLYCSLDAGILLSNSIIRKIKLNLDWCVKNVYSDSDDVNLGLCIMHSTSIKCSNTFYKQHFKSTILNTTFDFENDFSKLINNQDFQNSLTVYPIFDHLLIYKINAYFTMLELKDVQEKIQIYREKISSTVKYTPKNSNDITWPIGNKPSSKAMGRFDILRWTYFDNTKIFLETDFSTIKSLDGNQKEDINYILNAVVQKVNKLNSKLKYHSLLNGYWRFDPSRGIDYLMDLKFIDDKGVEIIKRMEICKPLGKIEILPIPYVTENSRINMIVTVNIKKKDEGLKFLEYYANTVLDKKDQDKISLTMILLYDPGYTSKGSEDIFDKIKEKVLLLTEKYKGQSKIMWVSIRLPIPFEYLEIEPLLNIAILDLTLKKFYSENLILVGDIRMELKSEYLNRVRMNTIYQWQIFSPIPFVEYHPDIAYFDVSGKNAEFDINRNHGHYDVNDFNALSFYVKDYLSIRKVIEKQIPLLRTDKDISKLLKLSKNNIINSIFDMFVNFSNLNPFRAVEPGLKLRYNENNCLGSKNNVSMNVCKKQKSLQLGNRAQLTRLILDYKTM